VAAISVTSVLHRVVLPLLFLPLAAEIGESQQPPPAGSTPTCAAEASVVENGPVEMRTRTLYAVAELGHRMPDTTKLYATFLLEEVAKAFRLPTPLGFTAWASADSFRTDAAIPVIANEMMVVVRDNGELRSTALTQSSLIGAIDAALDTAVRVALKSGAIPSPSSLRVRNDVTLYLALTFDPDLDLERLEDAKLPYWSKPATPPRRTVKSPIARIQLPTGRFSSPPRYDSGNSKRIVFPDELLKMGVDGDVTIQYVVGRDGRVTPGSIRLIGATDRGFADRFLRALKDIRYFPAEIAGCPAPVLINDHRAFRIGRP
jgi:hypothetical protein